MNYQLNPPRSGVGDITEHHGATQLLPMYLSILIAIHVML